MCGKCRQVACRVDNPARNLHWERYIQNEIPVGMGIVFEWVWEWKREWEPHRMVNPYRVPNNSHTFIKSQCTKSTPCALCIPLQNVFNWNVFIREIKSFHPQWHYLMFYITSFNVWWLLLYIISKTATDGNGNGCNEKNGNGNKVLSREREWEWPHGKWEDWE